MSTREELTYRETALKQGGFTEKEETHLRFIRYLYERGECEPEKRYEEEATGPLFEFIPIFG